jgi:hypothetical protein
MRRHAAQQGRHIMIRNRFEEGVAIPVPVKATLQIPQQGAAAADGGHRQLHQPPDTST